VSGSRPGPVYGEDGAARQLNQTKARSRRPKAKILFAIVTVGVAVIILHGSLYPYDFHAAPANSGPLSTLLGTWAMPPTSLGDLLANFLLYVPLGLFMSLAVGTRGRIWIVTLAGLLLCTGVELLQFYDAGRVTNASDVYLNTLGTWAGAAASNRLGVRLGGRTGYLNLVPCMLLAALVGYKLFPYVPTIDLHKYWHALKPLIDHTSVSPVALFRHFALWLTADYLVASAVKWKTPGWIRVALFAAFIFGAKILIVNQSLSLSEIIGAGCAFALWLAIRRQGWAAAFITFILCAAVVAQRLEPFDFQSAQADFGWLPFRSFLHGSLAANVQSMFEKAFLYGSLVWMACVAGMRLSAATAAAVFILLLTSFAETYLPGRSGEITDALIALAMGLCISAIQAANATVCAPAAEHPKMDRVRL
jgi:VanZ family protein